MSKRFAISLALFASIISTVHSSGRIDSVSLASERGDEQRLTPAGDNVFRHNQDLFKVQLEGLEMNRARIRFTYPANGREVTELLEAPFDEMPSTLALDDLSYDPSTSLSSYMKMLNEKRLPHKRVFEWNRAREVSLGNEMTPLVQFHQSYVLRFWDWVYRHSMEDHQSYVYFRYGPSSDQIVGEYLAYACLHRCEKKSLESVFYLGGNKLRSVASAAFYDAPWFEENKVATHLPYASPEADSDGVIVIDPPHGAADKYYQPGSSEWLQSRYIYADGKGQCFLTKLKRLTLIQVKPEDHGKEGVKFVKVEGQPAVQLVTLDQLDAAPILLPPNRQITPAFNRGYYQLISAQTGDLGERIERYYGVPHPEEHVFTHKESPALQGFEGTDLLLQTPDSQLAEIIACVKHFLPDMDPARTFKVMIRLAEKSVEEKTKVGNRLLRLLAADPRLFVDAEGLDGELSYDQDLLGDEALATFVALVARVPNLKMLLKEVAIKNWKTFANGLQNQQVFAQIQPKCLRVALEADEDLESVKQFISANPQLTHLYLTGFTGRLDIPFMGALADHKSLKHIDIQDQDGKGFIDRGHLGRLKSEDKASVWPNQKDALAAKWRGVKSLDFRDDKYPFQYNITGINLLTANVDTITCLYLTGLKGFKQYGSRLVEAVDKMTNLTLIELMGDILDNFETVAMAKALSTKQNLTYVTMDMPYCVSHLYNAPRSGIHEIASSQTWGDLLVRVVAAPFVAGVMVAISPVMLLLDLAGEQTPEYDSVCKDLAIIPKLSYLKLVLWGARTYEDWTIGKIKQERAKANLPNAQIEIEK